MLNIFKSILQLFRHPRNIYSLVRASIVYYLGRREAMEKFRKTGHRFYCIFDPNDNTLVAITYKAYPKRADSYQYLRRRGRIAPLTEQKFKEGAFYYTPSKNGAQEMPKSEQQHQLDILRMKLQTKYAHLEEVKYWPPRTDRNTSASARGHAKTSRRNS